MNDSDLLRCIPLPAVDCEKDSETGKAILLKPRYGRTWLGRLLTRRLADPWVKVHLDELGTWLWELMDGERTLAELATLLEEEHPDEEGARQRLLLFVRQLVGTGLMVLRPPAGSPHGE